MRGTFMLAALTALTPGLALPREAAAQARGSEDGAVRVATGRAVPANVVGVDFGALLSGALAVSYERAFTPSFSLRGGPRLQLGPAPFLAGWPGDFLEEQVGFGGGVEAGARGYLRGFAPQGALLELDASMLVQSQRLGSGAETLGAHLQAGLVLGYQLVVARRFVVSGGFGAILVMSSYVNFDVHGLAFPLHLALGAAF